MSNKSSPDHGQHKSILPSIELPKGGGAINTIGEKFSVNTATGTGSASIPIPVSPGRNGVQPSLSLSYDSGAGNTPFGLGWNLSIPSISRKSAKGLPQYNEQDASDVFLLAGAEDLVPFLEAENNWLPKTDSESNENFHIHFYRPRTEGGFSKIEKWIDKTDATNVHWKITSGENITSIYGREARTANPNNPSQIFEWLLEETHDNRGNIIRYEYQQENGENLNAQLPCNQHRSNNASSYSKQYIKTISYCNNRPYIANDWHFQVVFDYGDHAENAPDPTPSHAWPQRKDAFSTYRSGFEIRTNRLCQRILLFHHFEELNNGTPTLVRSTTLTHEQNHVASLLKTAWQTGYIKTENGYSQKTTPAVEFSYSAFEVGQNIKTLPAESLLNFPGGISSNYQFVDLEGEGLSGILTQQAGGWFYKQNKGDGVFAPAKLLPQRPSLAGNGAPQLQDIDGDGNKELVIIDENLSGFYNYKNSNWENFTPLKSVPNINWQDPNLKLIDLNGDGFADILITENDALRWFPSKAKEGYGMSQSERKPLDENQGPAIAFSDASQSIFLADMSGDGLTDIVRVRNNDIVYWPNLGYARFGAKVTMNNAPFFDPQNQFDPSNIRLADIDGSGTTDVLYFNADGAHFWINESGNGWTESNTLKQFPRTDQLTNIQLVDLLGTGTPCLVWSSVLPKDATAPIKYIDLMEASENKPVGKPYLLNEIRNNMGKVDRFSYAPSTKFFLADQAAGTPWITKLHFPVYVVEEVETIDEISNARLVVSYKYHHGYFDPIEREFRGFGMVEQTDSESFAAFQAQNDDAEQETHFSHPVRTKTWLHTGAYVDAKAISKHYESEYFKEENADDSEHALNNYLLPDSVIEIGEKADFEARREAHRTLRGQALRQEVYALDGSDKEHIPYTVTESNFRVIAIQQKHENLHGCYLAVPNESIVFTYERNCCDPRVSHSITIETDRYGTVLKSAEVVYPRRVNDRENLPAEQLEQHLILSTNTVVHKDSEATFYTLGIGTESKQFEVTGIYPDNGYFASEELKEKLHEIEIIPFHSTAENNIPQQRLLAWSKQLFWDSMLGNSLPFGEVEWPILPHHSQAAVFTSTLIETTFGDKLAPLEISEKGGYILDEGYWWNPGVITHFRYHGEAAENDQRNRENPFLFPVEVQHPLEVEANLRARVYYDQNNLISTSADDAEGNTTTATINYRTLAPLQLTDINENTAEVITDELGMVIATTSFGSEENGNGEVFVNGDFPLGQYTIVELQTAEEVIENPHRFLQGASTFFHYDLHAWTNRNEPPQFLSLGRETHARTAENDNKTLINIAVGYSDGFGRELQQKVKVEAGISHVTNASGILQRNDETQELLKVETENRWVTSGRTILNNKQKPIKQYEPFFIDTHRYLPEQEATKIGITSVLHYDPMLRVIRTDTSKGFFSKVEFSPWESKTYDLNDTIEESRFFIGVMDGSIPTSHEERTALIKAQAHYNTPSTAVLDSLGRTFQTIEIDEDGVEYITTSTFNISGQPVTLTDPRQRELNAAEAARENVLHNFEHVYDMAGTPLYSKSIDAGESWAFSNVLGNPMFTWTPREYKQSITYDTLDRPVEVWLESDDMATSVLLEKLIYATPATVPSKNLRGQQIEHYDQSGKSTMHNAGFSGVILKTGAQFISIFNANQNNELRNDLQSLTNWNVVADEVLEEEAFIASNTFNALGQLVTATSADESVHRPTFNRSGQLTAVEAQLRGQGDFEAFVDEILYNEKGQRSSIRYSNGVLTSYRYDALTYQLTNVHTTRQQAPNLLQDLYFEYDPVGNIMRIGDRAQQSVFFNNAVVEAVNEYTYDAFYQLKAATGREHIGQTGVNPTMHQVDAGQVLPHKGDGQALRNYTRFFDYDKAGNMLTSRHHVQQGANGNHTRHLEYDANSNRLFRSGVGQEENWQNFTYDAAGNMQEMAHLNTISWNYKNEIQHLTKTDLNAWYDYDSGGERTRKVVQKGANKLEVRYYFGNTEIYREYKNGALQLERETVHISDDSTRIAMVDTQTVKDGEAIAENNLEPLHRYQLNNHLGSASIELDGSAQIISYEEFYPYGSTSYQAADKNREVPRKRYRYTGMERDEESGLNYHSARYYAPWLCRWLKADPAGAVDGLNLFLYSQNRPITYSDKKGLQSEPLLQINDRIQFEEVAAKAAFSPLKTGLRFGSSLHAETRLSLQDKTVGTDLRSASSVGFYGETPPLISGAPLSFGLNFTHFKFRTTAGLGSSVDDNSPFVTSGFIVAGKVGVGEESDTKTRFRLFQGKIELDLNLAEKFSLIAGTALYHHSSQGENSNYDRIAFVGLNLSKLSFITYNDVSMLGGPGTDHLWSAGVLVSWHFNPKTSLSISYDAFTGTFEGRDKRFECESADGCYIQREDEMKLNRSEWRASLTFDNVSMDVTFLLPRTFNGQHIMHSTPGIAEESAEFLYLREQKGMSGGYLNLTLTY